MIDAGGDPVLAPGLGGDQDLDQGQGGDQDPVLALVAAILGLDQGLAAALVPAPDQGPGPSLGQDLGQSLQWKKRNQGQGHQVKKNLDLNHLWKLRMEEKKGSVQNHALGQVQSLVLSQDLVLENVQVLEVDLDQKVLSKTVNLHYLN